MAIMTHLPVKLLPVETARPWHRTQCLSASLLKSLKSQVDIILPATGITPSYNASIFSRSLELKAAKQWAPIGQMRHKVDQAKVWELGWGISTGQKWIYFWPEWNAPNTGLAICEKRSFLVRFVTVILTATIPLQPSDKHINLHIMAVELCKECSYLDTHFSRQNLKDPVNYSFTCQWKTSHLLDLVCSVLVAHWRELMWRSTSKN